MAKDFREQVDFVVKRFQENQKRLDDQDDILKCVKEKSDSFQVENVNINNRIDVLDEYADQFCKEFHNKFTEIKKTIDFYKEEKSKIEEKMSALKDTNDFLSSTVSGLSSDLEALKVSQKETSSKQDTKELVAFLEKLKFECEQFKNDCYLKFSTFGEIQRDINSRFNLIASFENKISLIEKKISESAASFQQYFHSNLEACEKSFIVKLNDLESKIMKNVNDMQSLIPRPLIFNPDEIKSSLKKDMEPISLDAKNANLRSTNTESRVYLLEKKVESLLLQLNKLNLQGAQ